MTIKKLLIIGAGGHGRAVAEAATLSRIYEVVGFVDDNLPKVTKQGIIPLLGNFADLNRLSPSFDEIIVAIGNNLIRETLLTNAMQLGFAPATVIHPSAIISPTAVIADGCTIMAGAIIGTEAELGLGAIVNCGAIVDHHAIVYDFAHLGVNSCMAGGSAIGRAAWMQAGASLGYGVSVPEGLVLAPGESLSSTSKN
jgi:sugar O-acyltransferase (sialic acid O-acetyltransferase NeuD family)